MSEPAGIFGKRFILDGQLYCIGLPGGGEQKGIPGFWDAAINACGESDKLWNWYFQFSWCQDHALGKGVGHRVARGYSDADYWSYFDMGEHQTFLGFRPMLWPIYDDGRLDTRVLSNISDGTVVKMFTKPVSICSPRRDPIKYKPDSNLLFSDRYFGDRYAIPWVIFCGMAMADRNLLVNISWEDLQHQNFV